MAEALCRARREGVAVLRLDRHRPRRLGDGDFVIVGGTLIPTDRIAADKRYYAQKRKRHGMNVRVIGRADGALLVGSAARCPDGPTTWLRPEPTGSCGSFSPGRSSSLPTRAYQGAGSIFRIPYYGHRELPEHYERFNRVHARLPTPGERAFARLKIWRILRRARRSTKRFSRIVQAVHTLLTCSCPGWKSFNNPVISPRDTG
ncbi:transposase family protein [Streptomyces sp. NPDC093097]|uniref:transposase family protein n=1 Tax=Streptomyces sp. NPDC093097 TaxID=3366027 RepID=UPI00382284B0